MQRKVAWHLFSYFIHLFRFFHTMNQNPGEKLDKDEFQEDKSMSAFWVIDKQFQKFIDWQYFIDYDSQMTEKFFAEYTIIKVTQFRETLLQHMGNVKKSVAERAHHQRQYERRVNNRQMQMQESMQDTSSSSGNYITHVVDVNIRPVNDQGPFLEVQLTAQRNVLSNEHQHTDQCEPIYDTYLLEKLDSNTSPGSTNMSHRGGEIDQDAEHDQIKSPLLKAKFLKMKDMVEKEVYNELSNRFLQIENIVFHLKFQYNKRKKVFKLINHHAPDSYSAASYFGGVTDWHQSRGIHTNDHNDSLIAQVNNKTVENADLKAQIQEKSERCKFLKPRFASHVDVINELSKPLTPHYVPKVKESVFVKPYHVIASGSSRNISNESYGSNDMAHKYYLERFSLNKSSAVRGKPNTPRSCLRWIPTSRIFKTAGLSSRLALQRQMASADNTLGPALQRKERFVATSRAVDPSGSPSSTTIDQDVPSTSSSLTTQEIQSQVTHQGAEEQIHGHQNAEFDNAPLIHNLSLDPSSEETTVQRVHSIKFTSSQPIV
nr:hypothetical protein [Tanacetum cinerariifolium]